MTPLIHYVALFICVTVVSAFPLDEDRFGKRGAADYVRFGKRADADYVRFGKRADADYVRFGKRSDFNERYGKRAPDADYVRFGKRSNGNELDQGDELDWIRVSILLYFITKLLSCCYLRKLWISPVENWILGPLGLFSI